MTKQQWGQLIYGAVWSGASGAITAVLASYSDTSGHFNFGKGPWWGVFLCGFLGGLRLYLMQSPFRPGTKEDIPKQP